MTIVEMQNEVAIASALNVLILDDAPSPWRCLDGRFEKSLGNQSRCIGILSCVDVESKSAP
jgi:hypothetical protein